MIIKRARKLEKMAKRKEGKERGERKKEREGSGGEEKGGRKNLKEPVYLPRAGPSIKSRLKLCDLQGRRRCPQGAIQKQVESS